jgi:ubiquinone/menaquinone biosynthesis C-methylase UbiE
LHAVDTVTGMDRPAGGSASFDRVADRYDETRGGMERARVVAAPLARMLPRDGPALEVGIGTGIVAAALAERGVDVVGIDLSPAMLRHAQRRAPGRVARADALHLPIRTGSVAAAYLVHVVHLVTDMERVLAEVVRVLRPGGVIVVSATRDTEPPATDVHEVLVELERVIGSRPERPDREELVIALARAASLELADTAAYPLPHLSASPAEVAARVTERSWSWMWDPPDTVWQPAARRAVDRLRTLPDQDVARGGTPPARLLAFRRPTPSPGSS